MNGRASSCVWTSTVTLRSCMHSSRPDCVFGEARLISSTRTMFAKIGPGRNSKRLSRWLKTFVPTTSAGSRSAVHCTRANCSSSERASARASVVLPTPGRSSRRMWPSAAMHDERLVEQLLADLDGARQRVGDAPRQRHGGLELGLGDAVGIFDAGHSVEGDGMEGRHYAVARCVVRRSVTVSSTARATAAFDVRGTWRSPDAVTMVTSFSTPSKPMSFRPMSLTTTASRPLRVSLSRP